MPRPFPKKISQIKPTLTNLAQTSHYMVEFGGLGASLREHLRIRGMDSRFITETMGLLCSRASLPGSGFATADIVGNYMGVAEKMAHTRTFVQMDLEFYVDMSYNSLKFMEHWMEFISSGSTTDAAGDKVSPLTKGYYFRMRYPNEYKCDQTRIIKFERDYKRYIEYRFFGLFPISLNATTVSYEGSNLLKASASFHYDRYISGKSYSYDVYRGEDNGKTTPTSERDDASSKIFGVPITQLYTSNFDLGNLGGTSSDLEKNFSGRTYGVLNSDALSRFTIGERLI